MKLFKGNITPRLSTLGDKIYPLVVDIKKGVKSGDAVNFVTADNEVGILSIELVNGDEPYDISGCIVCGTIQRPDTSTLNVYCDIVGANKLEIPLGVSGTYQEGVHSFDLKIYRGNEKVIGVPTMSYTVTGSLSSDGVVEGDDRLPVLTMVLDNAQDKLTRLDKAIAGATNDLEVKEARDGEVTLNARLERDLEKGKIHFVDVEGSSISTESEEGYLENVEIHGNTWQDSENLANIRSVGTKVEGQELYEVDVLSTGKNLMSSKFEIGGIFWATGKDNNSEIDRVRTGYIRVKPNTKYIISEKNLLLYSITHVFYLNKNKEFISLNQPANGTPKISFSTPSDCFYIRLLRMGQGTSTDIYMQLEEGTQATPYEPYQEDKLTILSPTPLEKVGDVADRIICKDGVYGVEKNVETILLNGSEGWGQNEKRFTSSSIINGVRDKLIANVKVELFSNILNGISSMSIATNGTSFTMSRDYAEDVVFLKEKLSKNNILVKYITTQPQFIPLPHSQQIKLRTFAGRTHISFDTEIEPTIKAQVPKSLGATVNTHTTQIDNLNKELDRVKKLEESTVSTVTTNKAFTTVSETNQGYFEDVKIEGRTLVNLFSVSSFSASSDRLYLNYTSNHAQNLTTGKLITAFNFSPRIVYLDVYNDTTWVKVVRIEPYKRVFVQLNGTEHIPRYLGLFADGWENTEVFKQEFRKTCFILEGDHTDKDITFFEGLKSVGQGTDEIAVSSVNFNTNMLNPNDFSSIEMLDNDTFKVVGVYSEGKFVEYQLKPNCTYNLKWTRIDGSTKWLKTTVNGEVLSGGNGDFTFTTDYTGKILFNCGYNSSNDKDMLIKDFCIIEKGGNYVPYVPHQSDKKQILYFNPTTQTWEKPVLREWDSIEKHSDGKYYYHKRSEEVVLNGSESWNKASDFADTVRFYHNPTLKHKIQGLCISDKFNLGSSSVTNAESILIGDSYGINIEINKFKLSTQDVAGFKQWLQANNVTVVYQLAQEEVYECTNLDLITYQNETNLIVNSGAIQPKITLKVLSNVSNVVKLLQEKVSVLENKFIKGLQQVLAGDMMSLAHLLYPEDFESNHEIQTLEL